MDFERKTIGFAREIYGFSQKSIAFGKTTNGFWKENHYNLNVARKSIELMKEVLRKSKYLLSYILEILVFESLGLGFPIQSLGLFYILENNF